LADDDNPENDGVMMGDEAIEAIAGGSATAVSELGGGR
jgi:hypothetical protein